MAFASGFDLDRSFIPLTIVTLLSAIMQDHAKKVASYHLAKFANKQSI